MLELSRSANRAVAGSEHYLPMTLAELATGS